MRVGRSVSDRRSDRHAASGTCEFGVGNVIGAEPQNDDIKLTVRIQHRRCQKLMASSGWSRRRIAEALASGAANAEVDEPNGWRRS